MTKRYWTLVEHIGGRWCPQFGDYDLQTVRDERRDYIDSGTKRRNLEILESGDTQAEIDKAVLEFNKDISV